MASVEASGGIHELITVKGSAVIPPVLFGVAGYLLAGITHSATPAPMYALTFTLFLFVFVLLHEAAHLVCGTFAGRTGGHIALGPQGASTRFTDDAGLTSNQDHMMIAAAGSAVQLAASWLVIWVAKLAGEQVSSPVLAACVFSIVLASVNLLPLPGFDGGLIVKCGWRTVRGHGRDQYVPLSGS